MTPQEWKEVDERLKDFYDLVKLNCDGYELHICLKRKNQMKNVLLVYINGKICGEWYINDCEERRRFFRPVSKYLHGQKARSRMKKEPKWLQKALKEHIDQKFIYYTPEWQSFSALKKHLIANNQVITLVKKGDSHADK